MDSGQGLPGLVTADVAAPRTGGKHVVSSLQTVNAFRVLYEER